MKIVDSEDCYIFCPGLLVGIILWNYKIIHSLNGNYNYISFRNRFDNYYTLLDCTVSVERSYNNKVRFKATYKNYLLHRGHRPKKDEVVKELI